MHLSHSATEPVDPVCMLCIFSCSQMTLSLEQQAICVKEQVDPLNKTLTKA